MHAKSRAFYLALFGTASLILGLFIFAIVSVVIYEPRGANMTEIGEVNSSKNDREIGVVALPVFTYYSAAGSILLNDGAPYTLLYRFLYPGSAGYRPPNYVNFVYQPSNPTGLPAEVSWRIYNPLTALTVVSGVIPQFSVSSASAVLVTNIPNTTWPTTDGYLEFQATFTLVPIPATCFISFIVLQLL